MIPEMLREVLATAAKHLAVELHTELIALFRALLRGTVLSVEALFEAAVRWLQSPAVTTVGGVHTA